MKKLLLSQDGVRFHLGIGKRELQDDVPLVEAHQRQFQISITSLILTH